MSLDDAFKENKWVLKKKISAIWVLWKLIFTVHGNLNNIKLFLIIIYALNAGRLLFSFLMYHI